MYISMHKFLSLIFHGSLSGVDCVISQYLRQSRYGHAPSKTM